MLCIPFCILNYFSLELSIGRIYFTMATSVRPEKVLGHLGGCGRYQILLATTLHSMKLTTAWTLYAMVMTAVVPRWRCKHVMTMLNTTEKTNSSYNSLTVTNSSLEKTCSVQGQACDVFEFDDYMTTMVSEVSFLLYYCRFSNLYIFPECILQNKTRKNNTNEIEDIEHFLLC